MIEGWKEVGLEDLGFVGRGKSRHRPRNAEFLYGSEYPFVQTADVKAANFRIHGYSQMYSEDGLKQSKLWPVNTLCVTIAANIADAALLAMPACFPDSVIGFTADEEKSDVRFVKYLFDILQAKIKKISQGAAQDNLSLEKLRTIKFTVPPLSTQRKIAGILSGYDDLIENNLKRIKLLEEQSQLTYEEWFLRMKFPGHESIPINVETGLPEGWQIKKIGGLADVKGGKRLPKGDTLTQEPTNHSYLRVRDLTSGRASVEGLEYITEETFQSIRNYIINDTDLYISIAGTVGLVGTVPNKLNGANLTENCAKICNLKSKEYRMYVCHFLNSKRGQHLIKSRTGGASQPKLALTRIRTIPLPIPEFNVLAKFYCLTNVIETAIEKILMQNILLKEGRDILLPRLMSGMIEV